MSTQNERVIVNIGNGFGLQFPENHNQATTDLKVEISYRVYDEFGSAFVQLKFPSEFQKAERKP